MITANDVHRMAREAADSDLTAQEAANKIVKSLRANEIRTFALDYVRLSIDWLRRDKARQVEAAAERAAEQNEIQERQQAERDRASHERASPADRYDPLNSSHLNAKDRDKVRRELGDQFPEWLTAHRERVYAEGNTDQIEMFEEDWHPGGVRAHQRERMWKRIATMLEDQAERVRIEVTEELLSTVFALGDGERVTWGSATIDQHRERIELLTRNVVGNVETATRHMAAVKMIQSAGVECLAEVAA